MKNTIFTTFIAIFTLTMAVAQKDLTNQLIWYSPEFSGDFVDALNSMNDGIHYSVLESSDANGSQIVKYSYESGKKVETIATAKDIFGHTDISIEDYSFSNDESMILIQTEMEPIYRHSFSAFFYVYDIKNKKTIPIADKKKGKQRLAELSPDNSKVAFVRDNNIYFLDLTTKVEEAVTKDGEINKIINGATDWVYEEEFSFDKGFYWGPKGDKIAYYRFDESNVREFGMDMYGELYPDRYTFKYPKAGEKNSVVSIHIYDVNSAANRRLNIGSDTDIYIPRIKWTTNNDALCVMRMNRHQNHLEFLITDLSKIQPFDIELTSIYDEKADTYIDVNDALTFLGNGQGFIWNSERDGFNHLYHFDMKGNVVQQLTKGSWDVIDFYGFDEPTQSVYYSSSQNGAMEKQVFVCTFKKGKAKTTALADKKGSNDANFSKGFKFFILNHNDANTPSVFTLHNQVGKEIRVLVDNKALNDRLSNYNLTKREFFSFKNSEGIDLNCWMMKPSNFDPAKEYPVLVAIYGGPGHNTVVNQWEGRNMLWHQLLCQEGYIVVSCDPRGTQFRGREFKHATYMNLGKLETNDFIDFAKYLGNLSYVDKGRIGMQGWSYGGYMTSLCMTKGADFYKTGIAVAPVTNWKYYDSVYTERFMRTPQENNGGYENNSPINFASSLKGNYLLVHGSADDNVHYQNTMDMISALVKANKQFDLFIYPNKNHGIYGGTTRLHLFTKMTDFLKTNL